MANSGSRRLRRHRRSIAAEPSRDYRAAAGGKPVSVDSGGRDSALHPGNRRPPGLGRPPDTRPLRRSIGLPDVLRSLPVRGGPMRRVKSSRFGYGPRSCHRAPMATHAAKARRVGRTTRAGAAAFTLVEMLIALAILALLVAMAAPAFHDWLACVSARQPRKASSRNDDACANRGDPARSSRQSLQSSRARSVRRSGRLGRRLRGLRRREPRRQGRSRRAGAGNRRAPPREESRSPPIDRSTTTCRIRVSGRRAC